MFSYTWTKRGCSTLARIGILPDEGGQGKRFLAQVKKKGAEDYPSPPPRVLSHMMKGLLLKVYDVAFCQRVAAFSHHRGRRVHFYDEDQHLSDQFSREIAVFMLNVDIEPVSGFNAVGASLVEVNDVSLSVDGAAVQDFEDIA